MYIQFLSICTQYNLYSYINIISKFNLNIIINLFKYIIPINITIKRMVSLNITYLIIYPKSLVHLILFKPALLLIVGNGDISNNYIIFTHLLKNTCLIRTPKTISNYLWNLKSLAGFHLNILPWQVGRIPSNRFVNW